MASIRPQSQSIYGCSCKYRENLVCLTNNTPFIQHLQKEDTRTNIAMPANAPQKKKQGLFSGLLSKIHSSSTPKNQHAAPPARAAQRVHAKVSASSNVHFVLSDVAAAIEMRTAVPHDQLAVSAAAAAAAAAASASSESELVSSAAMIFLVHTLCFAFTGTRK